MQPDQGRENSIRQGHLRRALVLTALLIALTLAPAHTAASPPAAAGDDFGGGPIEPPRDLTTEAEVAAIQAEVTENIARLAAEGRLSVSSAETGRLAEAERFAESVTFEWPLRAAANLADYGYHAVSGFVDHNPATDALLDYTCGDRTYDLSSGYNHQGTDFFTYPFPWLKMDYSQVEIVAAAAGTLVFKRDGGYDRQCEMTGALSNAVVIRHADGSLSYYLHMKKLSVTAKAVGDTVAAGEYLGVVGSSGSSTGPHLHFEVRSASNEVLDPFHGDCNAPPSLWAQQPPYYDSAVIAVHTGSAPPYRPPCPEQEVPNIEDSFEPADTVYCVTTYRDQLEGQTSTYRIIKPDGTPYRTWTHASTREHYSASYWYWAKKLDGDGPPPAGTWAFEVEFEGNTYATHFDVGITRAITITHPDGGEVWHPPALVPITWQDNLEGNVAVDLYAGGTLYSNIVTSTQSHGLFWWGTGTSLPSRDDYTVRITDATKPSVYDDSDAPFTIARVPTASFTLAPNSGIVPLTVTFTDTSTSLVDSRLWDLGDGLTATLQHPTHIYTATGVYTVTLAVSGPAGSDSVTHTDAITVTPPPLVADFSAHPILGTPPLTVTFTDRSGGPPTDRWLWAFGDGLTSTLQHPPHVYTQTGSYTVTLTAGAGEEEDLAVKPRYVHVVDRLWHAYLPVVMRDQAQTGAARTTDGY